MAGTGPEYAAAQAQTGANISPLETCALITRLSKRSQFLHAAKGTRAHSAAFVLQSAAAQNPALGPAGETAGFDRGAAAEHKQVRFGFTVSKKNGNAVKRNRIKRRLKAALLQASNCSDEPATRHKERRSGEHEMAACGVSGIDVRPGYDYVVVARPQALTTPFADLVEGLRVAVRKIHSGGSSRGRRRAAPSTNAHTV